MSLHHRSAFSVQRSPFGVWRLAGGREDEYLLVVEGTVRVLYGEKTFDATAGTMVSLLRGHSTRLGKS